MMIWTFTTFFAIPIHIVPAQFPYNMLLLTKFSVEAKTHIKAWATLIHMPVCTMLPSVTFLLDKVLTYFKIVTKITSLTIRTLTIGLKLLAGLNFRLIMRMRTTVSLFAFTMNKFLTHSVCSQFGMVCCCCGLNHLIIITCLCIHLVVAVPSSTHVDLIISQLIVVLVGISHISYICLYNTDCSNLLTLIIQALKIQSEITSQRKREQEMQSIISQQKIHFYQFMQIDILHQYIQSGIEYMVKSILSSNDKFISLRYYYQQIATLISGLKDVYFLARKKGIYAENFYGLQRVNQGRTRLSVLIEVLLWVVLPYICRKLQAWYNLIKEKSEDSIQLKMYQKIVLKVFPIAYCLIKLIYTGLKFNYLINPKSKYYSPDYWVTRTQLGYIDQQQPSPFPIMTFLKSPGLFLILIAHKVATSIFSMDKKKKPREQNIEIKPPIQAKKVKECPVCGGRFKNPAVLRSSGYVFCYDCIMRHVRTEAKCPVTQIQSKQEQIQIIYQ